MNITDINADPNLPRTQLDPEQFDGRLYLAQRRGDIGVKAKLLSVHATQEGAYDAVVNHAGEDPDDDLDDWPEGDWGEESWAWKPNGGPTYSIHQYVWSGVDGDE